MTYRYASMASNLYIILALTASVAGSVCAWSKANAAFTQCSTAPVDHWLITPEKCIGTVPWTGSEADFNRAFGAHNVKKADLPDSINSESETAPGIILFPEDSLKSVSIVWKDPARRRGVGFCYLQYLKFSRPTGLGYWHLASGIRLGMDIRMLERKNHRKFSIRLTNIDLRSGVASWQGGGLAAEEAFVGLDADEGDQHIDQNFHEIEIVWSSDKTVQAADLWVDYIAP